MPIPEIMILTVNITQTIKQYHRFYLFFCVCEKPVFHYPFCMHILFVLLTFVTIWLCLALFPSLRSAFFGLALESY